MVLAAMMIGFAGPAVTQNTPADNMEPSKKVARFHQLEGKIHASVEFEIARRIPLVQQFAVRAGAAPALVIGCSQGLSICRGCIFRNKRPTVIIPSYPNPSRPVLKIFRL